MTQRDAIPFFLAQRAALKPQASDWQPAPPQQPGLAHVANTLAAVLGWNVPASELSYALTPDGKLHIRQQKAPPKPLTP